MNRSIIDNMKAIPLTQGKVALVDDEDFEWLSKWKWYAWKSKNGWYAMHNKWSPKAKKQKIIRMHRFILGTKKDQEVDHKDHNGLNNQRTNLRSCTHLENCMNQRPRKDCSSKYKGVHWRKSCKKWQCRIACHGKQHHLGYFKSEYDAALQYDIAAQFFFGEFALLNLL